MAPQAQRERPRGRELRKDKCAKLDKRYQPVNASMLYFGEAVRVDAHLPVFSCCDELALEFFAVLFDFAPNILPRGPTFNPPMLKSSDEPISEFDKLKRSFLLLPSTLKSDCPSILQESKQAKRLQL
jgi:hypothetical protein